MYDFSPLSQPTIDPVPWAFATLPPRAGMNPRAIPTKPAKADLHFQHGQFRRFMEIPVHDLDKPAAK